MGRVFGSRDTVAALLLIAICAVLSAQFSFRLREHTTLKSMQREAEVLSGEVKYPEFQNRVMFPLLQAGVRAVAPATLSDESAWHAARFIEAMASFLVLYLTIRALTGSALRASLAVVLTTYEYLCTPTTCAYEIPSDFFDILFVSLFVLLAVQRRAVLLPIVATIAGANRESAGFAGIVWLAIAAARAGYAPKAWRDYLPGVAAIVTASAVVLGLRYGLAQHRGFKQEIGLLLLAPNWREFVAPFGAGPLAVAMLAPLLYLLRRLARPWQSEQRGLLVAAALCAAITLVFGIAAELRVWLPSMVMLIFIVVLSRGDLDDGQWLLMLTGRRRRTA